jgi:hypothetical protein
MVRYNSRTINADYIYLLRCHQQLTKLFWKEEERAKSSNEKPCFIIKVIFCWILANRNLNNINKMRGWKRRCWGGEKVLERESFGGERFREDFPPFLFVLSLSLFLFLLLSTVLSVRAQYP